MGSTIGIVGLGRIGAFHAETLSRLGEVDGLVVTDERPEVRAAVAAKFDARDVEGMGELLASGVDAVVIAAATPAHATLVLAAVEAGVPVFCEKPIAATVAEAVSVVDRLRHSSVPVQIGYNRRFDPAFIALREAAERGELGWLHTVRSTTMDPAPPPAEYIAVSGGIFRDCSVHDFDVVRWLVRDEVSEVYATGSNQGGSVFSESGDVATATTVLTFVGGTLGVVSNARYNGGGYDCRLEVHGSEGTAVAGWDAGVPIRNLDDASFPAGPPHDFFMDRFASAYREELRTFLAVVEGRAASPCTPQDALEVARIAEAATLSLRQHRPVRLDEIRK